MVDFLEQKIWFFLLIMSCVVVVTAACHRQSALDDLNDVQIFKNSVELTTDMGQSSLSDDVCFEETSWSFWEETHLQGLSPLLQALETQTRDDLIREARRYGRKNRGKGRCLRGFRHALSRVMKVRPFYSFHQLPQDLGNPPLRWKESPGKSADLFLKWAKKNPVSLCRNLGLADVTTLVDGHLSPGQVALYQRGRCGYHRLHGHIEVMVSENEMCSDHCRTVKKGRVCHPDMVLAPVKDCSWLLLKDSLVSSYNSAGSASPQLM
ncbi:MAG: hypothetical protein AB8C84_02155 [Oligoflexales bacterium]